MDAQRGGLDDGLLRAAPLMKENHLMLSVWEDEVVDEVSSQSWQFEGNNSSTDRTHRLGFQGKKVRMQGSQEIWVAPLSGYRIAVLLVNCHATDNIEITVHWDDIGLPAAQPSRPVTSGPFLAFKHMTLDTKFTDKMTFNLTSHMARMFVLTPLKSQIN
ncbi:hypothetical protein ACQ4PT_011500 [Festuca glaucescens]